MGHPSTLDCRSRTPAEIAESLLSALTTLPRDAGEVTIVHGEDDVSAHAVAGVALGLKALGYFEAVALGANEDAADPGRSRLVPRQSTVCGRPGSAGERPVSRTQDMRGRSVKVDVSRKTGVAAIALAVTEIYSARQRGADAVTVLGAAGPAAAGIEALAAAFAHEGLVSELLVRRCADGTGDPPSITANLR